jgi:hypothetical protein
MRLDFKLKKNRRFFHFFPLNCRGDIPTTILVIGVLLVCALALSSFYSSTTKIRNNFVGIGLIEKMNSEVESNFFYTKELGFAESYANINSAFNYAKGNEIVKRRCNCGDDCDSYAVFVTAASSENGIPDPLLLLSLMMQESTCISKIYSGSSVGLMQVNLIHCGSYGLPSDKNECKEKLMNDPKLNIETGAKILKESYDTYKNGKIFQGCSGRNIIYYGWEAALRGYIGWGCGRDESGHILYAQDNYVEEVMSRYEKLKEISNYVESREKDKFWKLERKKEFPFVKRKDKFLFSAKYSEP